MLLEEVLEGAERFHDLITNGPDPVFEQASEVTGILMDRIPRLDELMSIEDLADLNDARP